jgi:hypothetical protein
MDLKFFINVLLLMGTKKPTDPGGRAGARWEPGWLSQGGQGGCCVVRVRISNMRFQVERGMLGGVKVITVNRLH